MALTLRLDLRQTTSLVMTPQLQQAIKLLQLSNLELSDYLTEELERNPLLERVEEEAAGGDRPEGAESANGADAAENGTIENGETEFPSAAVEAAPSNEAPLDVADEDMWTDSGPGDLAHATPGTEMPWTGSGGRSDFADSDYSYENTLAQDPTLREHLTDQLQVDVTDPVDRLIGLALIDLVDESGYIPNDLEAVAERLDCPLERVEAALETVQGFDPSGIFARNLRECLALQLRDRNRLDPAMEALLDNLDLLARRDLDKLRRVCRVDAEDLGEMVREIRALNPKPGDAFDAAVAQPVTPDVLMRPDGAGGWLVELNSDNLPRVLVNTSYYARVNKAARNKDEKAYIAESFQSANWLVKSLHQRATTILKVASEIVRQQDGFFAHGVQYLKPLVLRNIAEAISMHESTVSRVTTNKYMATPRGMYELKYFFTSSIPSTGDGDAHSAEAVRHRIRGLIDAEAADKVLSDDGIVALLRTGGIDIARRTVAKYRESMRIPSSVQRRREKALAR
ncbi:MAG: RNA polymerase factor sigma-54 [Rhodospirillaceae bacterium]|jgi:RNA polymerase sigma-54 factor|nr:RNA polymerase factor sigma-54 [Rhodospirillaceae bacterium]